MKVIVITGSTRGIGYGLAEAFIDLGCALTISGRSLEGVEQAVAALGARNTAGQLFGYPCDVVQYDQVLALWEATCQHFGHIDIWINNAGISHRQSKFWEYSPDQVRSLVDTNLVGVMYGAMVAMQGMLEQGFGALYNMEGFGSDGRWNETLTLYGTSKRGVHYLTQALMREAKGTPILVGSLSPGMVVTDMLTGDFDTRSEEWNAARRVFNVLADKVETVAPWMAEQVLYNSRSGVQIRWLNRRKILSRFLLAPFRKRDLFS